MVDSEILPPVGSPHAASVLLAMGRHTYLQSFGFAVDLCEFGARMGG